MNHFDFPFHPSEGTICWVNTATAILWQKNKMGVTRPGFTYPSDKDALEDFMLDNQVSDRYWNKL